MAMAFMGRLIPFDLEPPYETRSVGLLHFVSCGVRDDYLWVSIAPPLQPPEAGLEEPLATCLLAPRHEGATLTMPLKEPVHVYVCRVVGAGTPLPRRVDPDSVEILHWAILEPAGSMNTDS